MPNTGSTIREKPRSRKGIGIALGAIALVFLMAVSGSPLVIVFYGAMAGGIGMLAHGLYRARQAAAAIAQAPDARVVREP